MQVVSYKAYWIYSVDFTLVLYIPRIVQCVLKVFNMLLTYLLKNNCLFGKLHAVLQKYYIIILLQCVPRSKDFTHLKL